MELDKFIKDALVEIAKGVEGAKSEVEQLGGKVNPEATSVIEAIHARRKNLEPTSYKPEQLIEFDIGLQIIEESNVGGEGKVKVLSFSVGANGSSTDTLKSEHRIKFSVPMQLP
jgi:hypothetical protein